MAGESNPGRLLDRAIGVCAAVLVGAMALWGAVEILKAIWVPLCLLAFVMVVVGVAWLAFRRWRGW
ncbi:hypothetical protein [Flexivirga caeni]|uniref:Uncharacterized protein n=1 Tax=Flexivirga caeni TaxID=2294115 RepID=A0A3M9LUR5_9MICO|nr:hypothetical protein [Flexivirga caeni]RNI17024.1 hypothetical protein EFY87_19730 [Flexivirga caeni]